MKKVSRWVCALIFLALCVCVIWFLHLFTVTDKDMVYINWESAAQIMEDGTEIPYAQDEYTTNTPSQSGTFRFTAHLPEGLGRGYLLFETSGLELVMGLDGREIYRSSAVLPDGTLGMAAANIPLPENAVGELTVTCTILDGTNALFPPLLRFVPDGTNEAQQMSYANRYGIPAGVAATALLLVCGLFLMSVLRRRVEWSLLPLALALVGLTGYRLIQSCGYYFLPEEAVRIFSWQGFAWLAPLALAVFLAMNCRRDFWKLLGLAAIWSAGALLAVYLISLAGGGYLSSYLSRSVSNVFLYGFYDGLLYWFTLWLAVVCALISGYWFLRSLMQRQAQAQALELKNQLVMDSYRAIERKMGETAALRHELRHQISALDALYQQKDYEQLGKALGQWKQQSGALVQSAFTENFTVNAILQDAASRAAETGTAFCAQVNIPGELGIPENDLCVLLMNMLDNALEASAGVEKTEERFICFKAEIKNGFFAVKCENRYAGTLKEDGQGRLMTVKRKRENHGIGLAQMSAVAEKYHSMLDISQTETHVFVVQTALKLPEKRQK